MLKPGEALKNVWTVKFAPPWKLKATVSPEQGMTSENEEVHNRPWQYSVDAGLGLQFNITKNYGLFAEPTIAYYINDDDMRTYRNEHDFSFQLAVGLRVSY